jgi:tetratricopeptide (TPR) repeat protein
MMNEMPRREGQSGSRPAGDGSGRSERRRTLVGLLAIGIVAVAMDRAGAGPVTVSTGVAQPTTAADLGDLPKTVAEVGEAVKSFEKRDIDACLRQLGKAVKAHPELPPPHALLAKLAFLTNQTGMIRTALEQAVAEDGQHPEVYILFGNLALMEGRLTDGALHFDKGRALTASQRWTAEQRKRFERLCNQGDAYVAELRGDWKTARTALAAWLEQEPANAHTRQRLGRALFGVGQYEQAHAELVKASEADATLDPAAVTMGWLYTRDRDRDLKKGGEWMEYAVKLAPESVKARIGIASWLLEQGRADEAKAHVEAAAKLDPKSNEVRRLIGLAARQRKDYAAAEQVLQALTQESPGDAGVRNQLAMVLAEQADDAKRRRAIELAELSVRQDPNSADALTTLGIVYYRNKRLDDAFKVLQSVFASGRGNSDGAYVLALVLSDKGHPENVAALLKSALEAQGLFVFRNDAQQWLDRLSAKAK